MVGRSLKSVILRYQSLLLAPVAMIMDKRYFAGRHFDGQLTGLIWAYRTFWQRNILRLGKSSAIPMGLSCRISKLENFQIHPDDINNLQSPNLYVQNYNASVSLGRGTYIGPNVGLITANHNFDDLDSHGDAKDIEIGERCWIGMNSVIMPGVTLGKQTIVGAGSIVTKSFPEGRCLIAGAPARILKNFPITEETT
jgi:acetyltransferase-like isoleucine patch superfamily enzyme